MKKGQLTSEGHIATDKFSAVQTLVRIFTTPTAASRLNGSSALPSLRPLILTQHSLAHIFC
jgi:hypothetical protein